MTEPKLSTGSKLKRSDHAVTAEMNGELVMMDIERGVYFALNGTGSHIWAALDQPTTLAEITESLRGAFEVADGAALEAEVADFLFDLQENGLVTIAD